MVGEVRGKSHDKLHDKLHGKSHGKSHGKFHVLMEAGRLTRVPTSAYLDDAFFSIALALYEDLDAGLTRILEEIDGTSGAFLGEQTAELAALLANLGFSAEGRQVLRRVFEQTFPDDALARSRYAVRSAAPGEDSARRSYAGLYTSVLGVSTLEGIEQAVLEVWKSFFSYPALLERLADPQRNSPPERSSERMAVMIQPMVEARLAGVCFTADPLGAGGGGVVEYVEGLGDRLVSGVEAPTVVREAEVPLHQQAPVMAELFEAARALEEHFGHPLDLEWAWDGEHLWILQVRPISTLSGNSTPGKDPGGHAEPVLAWRSLYGATESELAANAPLPPFAVHFRQKRGPLFRFAQRMGVARGEALLVRYNQQGLEDSKTLELLLRQFVAAEVVVDAHANYRQRILPRSALVAELRALAPRSGAPRQIVIRDYIRGTRGIISRAMSDDSVLYEVAEEGLLALNRGTAGGRTFHLRSKADPAPELPADQVEVFFATTLEARKEFGPNQLEWVLAEGRLVIVDYSPLNDPLPAMGEGRIVSSGYAVATVVRLEPEEALRRLSVGPAISLEGHDTRGSGGLGANAYLQALIDRLRQAEPKPIVLAPRPFAVLAVLIPQVGGFVFEQASTLCHLAILLREHGVPAIESPELYATLKEGSALTLDARGDSAPRPTPPSTLPGGPVSVERDEGE